MEGYRSVQQITDPDQDPEHCFTDYIFLQRSKSVHFIIVEHMEDPQADRKINSAATVSAILNAHGSPMQIFRIVVVGPQLPI